VDLDLEPPAAPAPARKAARKPRAS
jgi:hypothetical protein